MTHTERQTTPAWVVDVSLAVAVATVLVSIVALSQVGTDQRPTLASYIVVASFGAVLLMRRRFPLTVLTVSVLGTFAYYGLQNPPIGVALPVAGALFSTAERGRTRWAVAGGAVVFVVSFAFRLRDDPQPVGYLLGTEAVSTLALIAAAVSLGHGIHARRTYIAQQGRIRELSERVEREHISRELHDSVGHGLSVIALHSAVGREAVGTDDATVAESLDQIRTQSSATLGELRAMLRLLRDADRSATPCVHSVHSLHSVDDIDALVSEVERAGVRVTAEVTVTRGELSPVVDAAAYRIIQESVTNVLRHSGAMQVQVSAVIEGDDLVITVADDGRGGQAVPGFGLTGMTERVRVLGGTLTTRTRGGFTVAARIPARLEP